MRTSELAGVFDRAEAVAALAAVTTNWFWKGNDMKRILIVVILAAVVVSVAVPRAEWRKQDWILTNNGHSRKCVFCNGTGFKGSFNCNQCKGTGRL